MTMPDRRFSWIIPRELKFVTANRKMRSDSIMNSDPRATVLVAPPGADPKVHSQQNNSRPEVQRWHPRGGRRGGRGRRGGGAGGGAATMDID